MAKVQMSGASYLLPKAFIAKAEEKGVEVRAMKSSFEDQLEVFWHETDDLYAQKDTLHPDEADQFVATVANFLNGLGDREWTGGELELLGDLNTQVSDLAESAHDDKNYYVGFLDALTEGRYSQLLGDVKRYWLARDSSGQEPLLKLDKNW